MYLPCSLVGFSQPKTASQQYFSLTTNQHQPAQTSPETNQRTGRLILDPTFQKGIVAHNSSDSNHPNL